MLLKSRWDVFFAFPYLPDLHGCGFEGLSFPGSHPQSKPFFVSVKSSRLEVKHGLRINCPCIEHG